VNTKSTDQPKVTLVGVSGLPFHLQETVATDPRLGVLQVIAIIWKQSKTTQTMEEIIAEVSAMTDHELADLMESVMIGVPVVEAVSFSFIIENASIGWREQMVRHRVGTKPDIRVGADWIAVDTIPEQADMSAWAQSFRLLDLSHFADQGRYRTPDSIRLGSKADRAQWNADMQTIQAMYARWAAQGLPLEDARDLIPLGATSRLSWTLNLRTLQHIVAKRGCTILQLGYWGPIINGIVCQLVTHIHPCFGSLVTPPCLKNNKWVGCIFPEDIRRRFDGRDHNLPVCPLYIGRETTSLSKEIRAAYRDGTIRLLFEVEEEAVRRTAFWGRNAWTGEVLTEGQNPANICAATAMILRSA
jgi:hypothetical protein